LFVRWHLIYKLGWDECEKNSEVRAIYLTAEGKAFCAGQDLAEAIDPNQTELTKIVEEHYNPIIERLRKIEKPIVCAVNGVAAGAGANIALACDITLAAKSLVLFRRLVKLD
jgi:2-(1,2-epoxy-1,2-dihydrophenyl)acetyl-CoA isomerase